MRVFDCRDRIVEVARRAAHEFQRHDGHAGRNSGHRGTLRVGGRNDARKIGAVMVVEIAPKNRCAAAEEIPAMEVVDITVLVVVAPILLFAGVFINAG